MKQETKVLIGIGLVTVLIIIAGAFFLGGSSSPNKPAPPANAKTLIRPNNHEEKVPNAKVTLVEFGDFECPACGASYPIVTQILQDYKGKINFVFRNFPLTSVHPNAMIGAEAAEAAGSQGKFFDMYNALYSNQTEWGESKNPLDYFLKYAKNIGLDVNKFKSDVQDNKYNDKIQQDINDGNALGVNATPTFYINGEVQSGGLPYDQFKSKIDAALNNK